MEDLLDFNADEDSRAADVCTPEYMLSETDARELFDRMNKALHCLTVEEISPVNEMAQESVPVPAGLSIETPFFDMHKVQANLNKESLDAKEIKYSVGVLNVSFRETHVGYDRGANESAEAAEFAPPEKWLMQQEAAGIKPASEQSRERPSSVNAESRKSNNDPYYLSTNSMQPSVRLAESANDDLAGSGIPVVQLQNGALGEMLDSQRSKSHKRQHMGLASRYLNAIPDSQFDADTAIVRAGAMPNGASSGVRTTSKMKKKNSRESEDMITLENIDIITPSSPVEESNESHKSLLVMDTDSSSQKGSTTVGSNGFEAISEKTNNGTTKADHKKKHKKKRKKKHKERKRSHLRNSTWASISNNN